MFKYNAMLGRSFLCVNTYAKHRFRFFVSNINKCVVFLLSHAIELVSMTFMGCTWSFFPLKIELLPECMSKCKAFAEKVNTYAFPEVSKAGFGKFASRGGKCPTALRLLGPAHTIICFGRTLHIYHDMNPKWLLTVNKNLNNPPLNGAPNEATRNTHGSRNLVKLHLDILMFAQH